MMNEPLTQQEADYIALTNKRVKALARLEAGLATTPTPLADKLAIKQLRLILCK